MLGQRSAQWGVFEANTLYGDFVGKQTFYGYLAAQRGELFRDDGYAALYCLDNGRPSVPPSVLATALVLQPTMGSRMRPNNALTTICAGRWRSALNWMYDRLPRAHCRSFARN